MQNVSLQGNNLFICHTLCIYSVLNLLESKLDTAGFGPITLELHVLTLEIIKLLLHLH